ncbi:MAG: 50S ribosomal protein L11 [Myxococcota bacterium]
MAQPTKEAPAKGKGKGKKLETIIKLQIPAGAANPSPPVGPALGQHGVNIMEFCKQFNAKTQAQQKEGLIIPVEISVYQDKSFTFKLKTPPTPVLIKKALKLEKASKTPRREVVGRLTAKQVEEIAKIKMPDLNCHTLSAAIKQVEGTARNMGVEVIRE